MNKISRNIVAISLCAVLATGGVCFAFAQPKSKLEKETVTETTETSQTTGSKSTESTESSEVSKDETVYVMAGADGSVQKIVVSDWIKNGDGSDKLSDESDLTDIENVKGDETYTIDGNGMKVWDAQGNDIYYQGNTEKDLPVGMTVSYKLDGKTVSAEEIAGKSGKVTIRFDYENRQYETVEIDGNQEKIYVPFAMLTGLMLDNDNFRNVSVSNGKLVNDGDRTIVVGLAFPGLQEDLGISEDKLDIPDYVEITADATNFELGTTVTIATNEIFNDVDETKLESITSDTGSLTELTDAMNQLMDGSSELYDGLCTLLDKSNELVTGVNQLAEGAKSIKSGADSLDDGAAQLKAGLAQLSTGLNTLSSNSSSLNSGAAQVFNTLLATATTQVRNAGVEIQDLTIDNYAEVLNGVISSLDGTAVYNKALQTVTSAVEARRAEITTAVTAAVRTQVASQVNAAVRQQVTATVTATVKEEVTSQVISAATGMSKTDYDAAVAAGLVTEEQQAAVETAISEQMASEAVSTMIATNVNAQMETEAIQTTISQNIDAQMESESVQATISQNVESQMQSAVSENMSSSTVQSQISAAASGAQSISSLKASLDSFNTFYQGLLTYTNGVDSAASGANSLTSGAGTLKDGTAQLKSGAETLYNGVLTLKDGMPALVEGVTELRDGAMQLSDGMKQFNEQGIQKLVDMLGDDLGNIVTRLKATMDVSEDYCNFAGIASDMDGEVKFVYRTDEIKAEQADN